MWQCDAIKLVSRLHTEASSESKVETEVKSASGAVVKIPNIEPKTSIEDLAFNVEHEVVVIVTVLASRNDNVFPNFKVLGKVLKVSVDSQTTKAVRFQFQPRAPDKGSRFQLIV